MEFLTAPWREVYVRKICRRTKGCILCAALKSRDDSRAFILHRGVHNFIILNKFPYTPGHLMIAPVRHLDRYEKAAKPAAEEMAGMLRLCLKVLGSHYRPQGFNIGMNLGRTAGAGVTDHYHLHVICRWEGDSNFMPLVGGARVFVEDLKTTYKRLKPLFKDRVRRGKKGSTRPGRA
ncbi:MAG: HIT family hydrolase [Candidatus Aminicenantes bacterium RBG_13_63_10]|nr:MAG: HIT family hydrolase [Candidatus Aminicenantes bacterium RBG_13_63_10]